LVHFERFFARFGLRAHQEKLGQAQEARAAEISGWVSTLETDINPLSGDALIEFLSLAQGRP